MYTRMFVHKCECVHLCLLFSKPSIRQIMIRHDNGALMAAVKIIFDPPALSWPLFSVCLSISLTSISPLSHNPLCHSLKDSESLQHAGLGHCSPDKNPLRKTSPNHSKTRHVFSGITPLMTLFLLVFPFLTYFDFLSMMQVESVQGREQKTADALKRLFLLGYLAPFIFTVKRQSLYLSSICKHQ